MPRTVRIGEAGLSVRVVTYYGRRADVIVCGRTARGVEGHVVLEGLGLEALWAIAHHASRAADDIIRTHREGVIRQADAERAADRF